MTTIKPAAAEQAEALAQLIRSAYGEVAVQFALTRENCPKHPSNCTADWVRADMARGVRYWIAGTGAQQTGCVALEQPEPGLCYLERLAVHPLQQRRGIGRQLVDFALTAANDAGANKVGIGIIAAQTGLQGWYEAQGFVVTRSAEFPHLPFVVRFLEASLPR